MMAQDGFPVPSSIRALVQEPTSNPNPNPNNPHPAKKKRNLPGNPDPDAEVIALSPKSLMATNRFICEICNKGFQRDQNLQLHRRGHNLPWKLKQRSNKEVRKKVYICPEKTCVHHDPSRALGDLTGIKKHYSRKHGEKKWKCEKCSKKYAVQSDWKAHSKICGTREYKCDCGTIFSRKDSFITHRAFCDALAQESAKFNPISATNPSMRNDLFNGSLVNNPQTSQIPQISPLLRPEFSGLDTLGNLNTNAQKARQQLPLWLDQGNSNFNPIGVTGNSNAFLAPGSSTLPELVQSPQMNVFGSSPLQAHQWGEKFSDQSSQFTGSVNLSISSLQGGGSLKPEEENKSNMSETITSLFSSTTTQNHHHHHQQQSNINGPMSATALLQKAAQIGSTRSHPQFSGTSYGLMTSPIFNSQNNQNKDEVFKLMNSISSPSSAASGNNTHGDGGLLLDDPKSSSFMAAASQVQHGNQGHGINGVNVKEVEGGLTRDFLGVGGENNRSFLQQELAKFASMGSAMDMNQYNPQQQ